MQTNFQDRYNWMEEMIYCVHSLMQCNISSAQELPAHHTHNLAPILAPMKLCYSPISPLFNCTESVCSSLPYLLAPFLNPASRHAPTPVKKIWQFRLQPLNGLMQWNSYAHFDAHKSHLLKHTIFFFNESVIFWVLVFFPVIYWAAVELSP